jgi:hypothetical protein
VYLSQIGVLLGQLGCQPDQQDGGGGALDDARLRVLLHHLDQTHAVAGAHLVEQANGVVLRHVVCTGLQRAVRTTTKTAQETTT